MKVNYKLLNEKTDDNGFCPTFIRSSLNGFPLKYFTGEKCKPPDWDAENN